MRLLALATVSADGRPIVGPVDGDLPARRFPLRLLAGLGPRQPHPPLAPQVSATHLPGEELAVTVHGSAVPVDVNAPEGRRAAPDAARHLRAPLRRELGGDARRPAPIYWRIDPTGCSRSTCRQKPSRHFRRRSARRDRPPPVGARGQRREQAGERAAAGDERRVEVGGEPGGELGGADGAGRLDLAALAQQARQPAQRFRVGGELLPAPAAG